MQKALFPLALAALALTTTAADAWTRIQTEAEFRAQLVGRETWVEGSGGVTPQADGSVTGQWSGQTVRGRWVWDNGAYCRNLRIGSRETGTDCQHLFIRGNQLRNVSDRGRGREIIATLR